MCSLAPDDCCCCECCESSTSLETSVSTEECECQCQIQSNNVPCCYCCSASGEQGQQTFCCNPSPFTVQYFIQTPTQNYESNEAYDCSDEYSEEEPVNKEAASQCPPPTFPLSEYRHAYRGRKPKRHTKKGIGKAKETVPIEYRPNWNPSTKVRPARSEEPTDAMEVKLKLLDMMLNDPERPEHVLGKTTSKTDKQKQTEKKT